MYLLKQALLNHDKPRFVVPDGAVAATVFKSAMFAAPRNQTCDPRSLVPGKYPRENVFLGNLCSSNGSKILFRNDGNQLL